jgi:hypothetical protein
MSKVSANVLMHRMHVPVAAVNANTVMQDNQV